MRFLLLLGFVGNSVAFLWPNTQKQDIGELFSSLMQFKPIDTHFPRIFRTPNSYNAVFDVPGFSAQDLAVSVQDHSVQVKGNIWCQSKQPSTWFGERVVPSESEICIDRHVDARLSLPKDMYEHGPVNAWLENGVLTVSVPTVKERGFVKKFIDIFSKNPQKYYTEQAERKGFYDRASHAFESAKDSMMHPFHEKQPQKPEL